MVARYFNCFLFWKAYLICSQPLARYGSPTHWDAENDGELPVGSSPHNSHMGLPNLDATDTDDENDDKDDAEGGTLRTPTATSAVPPASSASHEQKRKSIADSIAEVSAHERNNHIKIAKINATAKTDCATQRETIKQQSNMDMELARMQHQWEEAAAQQAHEAAMFDRQAALEMARAGQGAYAGTGGAGPPCSNIDPSLR
jgi:hypothetical protein